MKNSLILVFTFFAILISEKTAAQNDKENSLSLEGVWELVSFYNYDTDGEIDTILKTNRQVKMYSKTRVMWSRFVETDTSDWFGYGNYSLSDGKLTEALDFGSKSMNAIIEELEVFEFDLILEKDKFTQIEMDENGNPLFAENYIRVE